MVSASISLMFLISNGIIKIFLETWERKNIYTEKLVYWLEAKIITWKKIISKALIDYNISHEEITPVINEEQNYFRLKESIRAKDDQLSDIERDRLIEHGKRVGQNERLNKKTKHKTDA